MEIFTLDGNFLKTDIIDIYDSIIWTERFSQAGDVTLVVPPTKSMIAALAEGTFLQIGDSREVMLLENQLIEDGTLKVTGNTLDRFLDQRIVRTSSDQTTKSSEWTSPNGPTAVVADIVSQMLISTPEKLAVPEVFKDSKKQFITNLSLGDIFFYGLDEDIPEEDFTQTIEFGPIYTAIQQLAQTHNFGFSLYLESADASGYSLKFTVYKGRHRTSDQPTEDTAVFPIVQFSPMMETLAIKTELRSIAGYKNVAYAYSTTLSDESPGVAYDFNIPDGSRRTAITPMDFKRRVIEIYVDDLDPDLTSEEAVLVLNQKARNALVNNNYVKMVDGEVIPQGTYKFGYDYYLGDTIELMAADEIVTKAKVTEFVRSSDANGDRAYPTISITELGG